VCFLDVGPIAMDRTAIAIFIEDATPSLVSIVQRHALQQTLDIQRGPLWKLVISSRDRHVPRSRRCHWNPRRDGDRSGFWVKRE